MMDTRLDSQAVAAAVVVADGAAVAGSGTAAAAHVVVVVVVVVVAAAAAYGKTTYTISHLNLYQHFPGIQACTFHQNLKSPLY